MDYPAFASSTPIEEVVVHIASRLGKDNAAAKVECVKLGEHWIDNLGDWSALEEDQRLQLGLPVMLAHQLNVVVEQQGIAPSNYYLPEDCTYDNGRAIVDVGKCVLIDRCLQYFTLQFSGIRFLFQVNETVEYMMQFLYETATQNSFDRSFAKAKLPDGSVVAWDSSIQQLLIEDSQLLFDGFRFTVSIEYDTCIIDQWLLSIGMGIYMHNFFTHDVTKFHTVLFLATEVLMKMGISEEHAAIIMKDIERLRLLSGSEFVGEWLSLLGFSVVREVCEKENISIHMMLMMNEAEIDTFFKGDCLLIAEQRKALHRTIARHNFFSSVQETFCWLERHGFEKYAYHFARCSIPFYAMPYVNFFIISEMGVTIDDASLLSALQNLKQSPTFSAKSVSFWLRDLELEVYTGLLARNGLLSLDKFTTLTEKDVDALIPEPSVLKDKLLVGIAEMREFQFFYLATINLLEELGLEKYVDLFALHGVSIDILPLLSDKQLAEMGISDKSDRARIRSAIAHMGNVRSVDMALLGSPDGALSGDTQRAVHRRRSMKKKILERAERPLEIASVPAPEPPKSESKSVEEWLHIIDGIRRPQVVRKGSSGTTVNTNTSSSSSSSKRAAKRARRKRNRAAKKAASRKKEEESIKEQEGEKETLESIQSAIVEEIAQVESAITSDTECTAEYGGTETANPIVEEVADIASLIPSLLSLEQRDDLEEEKPTVPLVLNTKDLLQNLKPMQEEVHIKHQHASDAILEEDTDDELCPEMKALLDAEVEEFKKRLELATATTKSKLTPVFYLPD